MSQNKWEHVSERALDILIDHLNTLNDTTPKIRCEGRNGVDPALIFGLDSKLFLGEEALPADTTHHDEVQTVTLHRGKSSPRNHAHACNDGCTHPTEEEHLDNTDYTHDLSPVDESTLAEALGKLSKETVWRVKGFVRTEKGIKILNWAFGRYELTDAPSSDVLGADEALKLTVMGERGEVKRAARKLAEALGAGIS